MPNGLIRKSAIYLVGNVLTKAASTLLVPIYAFFVSATGLGIFDVVQNVASLGSIVFFVAAWEALIRFAMAGGSLAEKATVIQSAVVIGVGGSALATAFAIVVGFTTSLPPDQIWATATIAGLTGILNIWQYSARSLGHSKLFVISGVLTTFVNLLLLVVLVCMCHMDLMGLLISYGLALVAGFSFLELKLGLLRPRKWVRPDPALIRQIIGFTFPLMLNLIGTLLLAGFGRILIASVLGAKANGQFAFAMKFAMMIAALGKVLTMVSIEETVLRMKTRGMQSLYSTILTSAWAILLAAGTLAVVGSRILFELLGHTQYRDSYILIPLLAFWAIITVQATNYGNAFQVANKTGAVAWTTALGLVVTIGGSLLGVRLGGIEGMTAVAAAMVIGVVVTAAVRRRLALRYVRFRESWVSVLPFGFFVATSVASTAPVARWAVVMTCSVGVLSSLFFIGDAIGKLRRIPDSHASRSQAV